MPKCDPTKDYYACLEVSPTCSTADIKKQFHKLALLYHPDRNLGKDTVARFQDIQEANEILTDELERVKYDSRRRVMGLSVPATPTATAGQGDATFRRPAFPNRSNPYQATSDFPPPPSRTRPRTDVPPPTAKSGADRYKTWGAAQPPPARPERTNSQQDARQRANVFTAWSHVNNAQKEKPQQDSSRRHNVPPPYSGQQRPVPAPPPTQTPGSSAFPPRTQAANQASPPRPDLDNAGARHAPRGSETQRDRNRARNAGFEPNRSGRDGAPMSSPSMHHSVRHGHEHAARVASENVSTRPKSPNRRPDAFDGSRSHSVEDVPFAEGAPKVKTPYPNVSGERTTYFDRPGIRRSSSVANPAQSFPNSRPQEERRRSETHTTTTPPRPHVEIQSSDEESSELSEASEGTSPELTHKSTASTTQSAASAIKQSSGPGSKQSKGGRSIRFDLDDRQESMSRKSVPELRSPTRESPETSRSREEDVNAAGRGSVPARSSSNPNMFHFMGQSQKSADANKPPETAGDRQGSSGAAPFSAERWTGQDWTGWAKPPERPSSGLSGRDSPSRKIRVPATRSASRGSASKPVTPQPASVEEEETGDPDLFTGPPRDDFDDLEPMDLDEDPPAGRAVPPAAEQGGSWPQQAARTVFVEPLKPEWRSRATTGGILNGDWESNKSLPEVRESSRPGPAPPELRSRPVSRAGPPPASATTRSTGAAVSHPSHIDLGSLGNVAPFQPITPGSGTNGFHNFKTDLMADIPFPSQASGTDPNVAEMRSAAFTGLPRVPAAPLAPGTVSRASYTAYLADFHKYLTNWNVFYLSMMARFSAGASALTAFTSANSPVPVNPQTQYAGGAAASIPMSPPGVMPFWLSAKGETAKLKGWPTYRQYVNDEARMRKYLDVAAEKHLQAVDAHEQLRARADRDAATWQ